MFLSHPLVSRKRQFHPFSFLGQKTWRYPLHCFKSLPTTDASPKFLTFLHICPESIQWTYPPAQLLWHKQSPFVAFLTASLLYCQVLRTIKSAWHAVGVLFNICESLNEEGAFIIFNYLPYSDTKHEYFLFECCLACCEC